MQSCKYIGRRESILVCRCRGGPEHSLPKERVQALARVIEARLFIRALMVSKPPFRMSGLKIPGVILIANCLMFFFLPFCLFLILLRIKCAIR
jgi:hypothetical protein